MDYLPLVKGLSVIFLQGNILFPLLKHKLKDTGQFIVIVLVTLRRVDISMCFVFKLIVEIEHW